MSEHSELPSLAASADGDVCVQHLSNGLTTAVIDRFARRNALSSAVLGALARAIRRAEQLGQRVLILGGQGGLFSAGADISELTGTVDDQVLDAEVEVVARLLGASTMVTIADIDGACVGAGLELASACDIRVADVAAFFALPALDMGLVYRPAAVARLKDLVGPTAASRLMLLGERLDARQAYDAGLVTVLASGDVHAESRRVATSLLAKPATSLISTTRMMGDFARDDFVYRWQAEHLKSFASQERFDAVAGKYRARRKS